MNKFNEVAQTILEEEKTAWSELSLFLKQKGLEISDLFEVEKYITKIIKEVLNSRPKNPFHEQ